MTRLRLTPAICLDLWYQAEREELGLIFNTTPDIQEYVRLRLYEARTKAEDPALRDLALHLSADGTIIIIYHKDQKEPLP